MGDPTFAEEALTPFSWKLRAICRDLWLLRGVNKSTDATNGTVVLIVTHHCITVITIKLALATALRTVE